MNAIRLVVGDWNVLAEQSETHASWMILGLASAVSSGRVSPQIVLALADMSTDERDDLALRFVIEREAANDASAFLREDVDQARATRPGQQLSIA